MSKTQQNISVSSLKYLSQFDNPYVRVVVICKVCSKEQSLAHSSDWKKHFLTHSDQKPHQCTFCEKSFIRADRLRNHIAKCHSGCDVKTKGELKEELTSVIK